MLSPGQRGSCQRTESILESAMPSSRLVVWFRTYCKCSFEKEYCNSRSILLFLVHYRLLKDNGRALTKPKSYFRKKRHAMKLLVRAGYQAVSGPRQSLRFA